MSDSDPGAGNLCNFAFSQPIYTVDKTCFGLIDRRSFLRAYD